jgi:hypothetical protein
MTISANKSYRNVGGLDFPMKPYKLRSCVAAGVARKRTLIAKNISAKHRHTEADTVSTVIWPPKINEFIRIF